MIGCVGICLPIYCSIFGTCWVTIGCVSISQPLYCSIIGGDLANRCTKMESSGCEDYGPRNEVHADELFCLVDISSRGLDSSEIVGAKRISILLSCLT